MINFGKKVLVVAAHPDDEVLGVGGTMALLRSMDVEVHVVIVTDGSSAQYSDISKKNVKIEEAKSANNLLGTSQLVFWSFPDMRLDTVEHVELNSAFEKILDNTKYDSVFSQHYDDMNLDHRTIYNSLSVAVRPFPGQTIKNYLTYPVNSSTEWGGITRNIFKPNVYVDIESTLELKLDAMREYKTEIREYPHPRSIASIRNRANVFGSEVGHKSAEAFRLIYSR